jgi:hypothetical protein
VTAITLPTSDSDHTQHDRSQRQRLYRYYSTPQTYDPIKAFGEPTTTTHQAAA